MKTEPTAKKAGELGFLARVLVQTTMPHSRQVENEYQRTNGKFSLSMYAPKRIGLPYGRYPRLLLAWICTEVVRTRSKELHMGRTFSGFLWKLGLASDGRTMRRFHNQTLRLFASAVYIARRTETEFHGKGFMVAAEHRLWMPVDPRQDALWESTVTLSQEFYEEILGRPVPLDFRAFRSLKSCLDLDWYVWLTWKLPKVRDQREVPWSSLALQFGANFERTRDFKQASLKSLAKVLSVYPAADFEATHTGLVIRRSDPHTLRR